jgi:hypothetical protein
MVDAPQPATNEGYRPSIRIHSMKANLRHTGRTKSLTLNHPLNQDHVCPNRSAHIRQCLCRFSGERCTSEAIDEWQWNGGSGEEHYEYRLFLAARSSFRCEQPSSCVGALRLDVHSRKFFVMQILTRECTAGAMFLRRSNVIFMKILCTVPKSPWSFPRNGECITGLDVSYVIRLKCQ